MILLILYLVSILQQSDGTKYVTSFTIESGVVGSFNITISDAGVGSYSWDLDFSSFVIPSSAVNCTDKVVKTGLKCNIL